jgi:hypothetical protein
MANPVFLDSLDIANRVCNHCGVPEIKSVDEASNRRVAIAGVYDKIRQYELRRNVWRFAKRKAVLRAIDATTRLLNPADWDETALYLPGSVVKWTNDTIWISFVTENVGNEPGVSEVWEQYYGPLSVSLYSSETSYYAGELVYKAGALDGSFIVYLSLANANSDVPSTTTAYDATKTYDIDDLAYSGGYQWRSVIAVNTGNAPAVAPDDWLAEHTYALNDTAVATDGYIYTSQGNGNLGNDPLTTADWVQGNPLAWERVPALQASSSKWLPLYAGLLPVGLEYLTLGIGPSIGSNIFRSPAGFLRKANLTPKISSPANDQEEVGDYITSAESILILAFSADITRVKKFDTMFCEGLAAHIALEVCTTLTQSSDNLAEIMRKYVQYMTEARTVNAIEVGAEQPEEDEFITVRG